MKHYDVIVIGAGAAGLMAAGRAAELGAEVLLVEKMRQIARKLRITGKGRCNITNTAKLSDFISCIHPDGKKLRPAFSSFFSKELVAFFNYHGLETVEERGGRIFPVSELASDVVDSLINYCRKGRVTIKTNCKVNELILKEGKYTGIRVTENFSEEKKQLDEFFSRTIIIATGGLSYPATGCTGDGYRWAELLGHKIHTPKPALVPLVTEGSVASELQGLSLKNVNVSVWINGKKAESQFGEMLFTHFGLSGPVILTLSRIVVDALDKNHKVSVSIDLKPALDDNKLDQRLLREINEHGKTKFSTLLGNLLPSKLIAVCADQLNISLEKLCNQLTGDERRKLRIWLKNFTLTVSSYKGFSDAIITAGGVETSEVNLETFESKLAPGVFIAGEILNFNADTGGYNLQIAFTSGWISGENAAKRKSE